MLGYMGMGEVSRNWELGWCVVTALGVPIMRVDHMGMGKQRTLTTIPCWGDPFSLTESQTCVVSSRGRETR